MADTKASAETAAAAITDADGVAIVQSAVDAYATFLKVQNYVLKDGATARGAFNEAVPVTLASSGTTNIGAAAANTVDISGTTTITAFDSIAAGAMRCLRFAGILTWTYNATSMKLPTSASITTAAGDTAMVISLGSGNWQCLFYQRKDGTGLVAAAGGGTKTWRVFTAQDTQPAATNFATLNTRNTLLLAELDASTEETFTLDGKVPESASFGSGVKVIIAWYGATATSGDVKWGAAWERGSTDLDADSFDTETTGTGTANGTSGILTYTTITCTSIDSIVIGDCYRLKIARKAADGADTMSGYAQIRSVEVQAV